MQRSVIQIARIRLVDVRPGDVVNARPDQDQGWFVVRATRTLGNGSIILDGPTNAQSANGNQHDLVGLQVAKTVEIAASVTPARPTPAPPARPTASPPPDEPPASPTPATADALLGTPASGQEQNPATSLAPQ